MVAFTAFETLDKISKIEDYEERKKAVRDLCFKDNSYAIIIQRCYHPEYSFDLPKGPIPENIVGKTNHDSPGPFFTSLKYWIGMTPKSSYAKHIKEKIFLDLYASVSPGDADLLVGIKDKKLPWENLSKEFIFEAIPELFPGYEIPKVEEEIKTEIKPQPQPKKESKPRFQEGPSKKSLAREIFKAHFNVKTRKEILNLMTNEIDIKLATAEMYYQQFRKESNA